MKREITLIVAWLAPLVACAPSQDIESAEAATTVTVPRQQAGLQGSNPTTAANALIATLSAEQRGAALYAYNDSAQKVRWSNLPTGIFARRGLRLGDLQPAQLAAVHDVLKAALSPEGYQKVVDIMNADEVLRAQGSPANLTFGKDEFYLAFLGTPSNTAPWMIQFGGHHLAINVTFAGSRSVLTPSLPAAQPATFTLEGRTVRPLGDEYDKAFALMAALDESQRQEAVLGFQVRNLVLGAGQDGRTIQPEGLRASRLNAPQQALLLDVASEWVNILNAQGATEKMAELRANLPDTYFAWSGPTTEGSAAYFRIQGPTVVIEYAPQGTTAGADQGTNHVHTIYRDPTNDYGRGIR